MCHTVLQLIPAISSLSPVTTAIPLVFVLGVTAAKDASDDLVGLSPIVVVFVAVACACRDHVEMNELGVVLFVLSEVAVVV